MSQQIIDNSTTTDTIAAGFGKVNSNFTELYEAKVPVGTVIDYIGTTEPSGWLILNGLTIGSASSGATSRANTDTVNLFTLLWNSFANAQASVSGGRGGSAAVDFAANKTITLPDARGRTTVGYGGTAFTTFGGTVGSETHTLTEAELPVVAGHTHVVGETFNGQAGSDFSAIIASNNTVSTQSGGGFGSGSAHNNIQPSLVLSKIIKL